MEYEKKKKREGEHRRGGGRVAAVNMRVCSKVCQTCWRCHGDAGIWGEFQTGTLGVQCERGAEQATNVPHVLKYVRERACVCVCAYRLL